MRKESYNIMNMIWMIGMMIALLFAIIYIILNRDKIKGERNLKVMKLVLVMLVTFFCALCVGVMSDFYDWEKVSTTDVFSIGIVIVLLEYALIALRKEKLKIVTIMSTIAVMVLFVFRENLHLNWLCLLVLAFTSLILNLAMIIKRFRKES